MFPNKAKEYLSYQYFRVGPASEQLSISGFTTDPIIGSSKSLTSVDMKFTTRDRDNDKCMGSAWIQEH